jgi:hypothetical protein
MCKWPVFADALLCVTWTNVAAGNYRTTHSSVNAIAESSEDRFDELDVGGQQLSVLATV